MSQDAGTKKLKSVLLVFGIFDLVYGILFLIVPGLLVSMSGSPEPVNLSWIRWAGGPLLAMGIAALFVMKNPTRQGGFVMAAALSGLFSGGGLLYSKILDHSTSYTWFHMTPCVSCLVLGVLLLWARQGAKEILE